MYSFTLSSTSAVDGVGNQRHVPAALPPEKIPYPLCVGAEWAPGLIRTGAEISLPQPGFVPPTVQPVASRYTDAGIATQILP
jgi:hypothetical protein